MKPERQLVGADRGGLRFVELSRGEIEIVEEVSGFPFRSIRGEWIEGPYCVVAYHQFVRLPDP